MLKEQIQQDLKVNFKGGKQVEVSVLRMIIAAINSRETEKRTKIWKEKPESEIKTLEKESRLTDEEILEVIFSEVKKRKESCVEYEKGGREDLAEQEKREIEIIQRYLPEQPRAQNNFVLGRAHKICAPISEEEIKNLAREVIDKVGATEQKDMGKVMAELMPKVKGKANGNLVSKIVKELLVPQVLSSGGRDPSGLTPKNE